MYFSCSPSCRPRASHILYANASGTLAKNQGEEKEANVALQSKLPPVSINIMAQLNCSAAVIMLLIVASNCCATSDSDLLATVPQEYCYEQANYSSSSAENVTLTEQRYLKSGFKDNNSELIRAGSKLCYQEEQIEVNGLDQSCSKWRFKYIDEQLDSGYEVKVIDDSLDERLANSLYTIISIRLTLIDFFRIDSGDPQQDERNLRSLEGPQVNGEQCHWQLRQMAAQLDELEARLEQKRQNASFKLGLDESHIRLARAMDSYGRYEPGMLLGKYFLMGSFGECKTSRLLLPTLNNGDQNQEQLAKMRFCWARLDLGKHMSASLKTRKQESYEAKSHVLQVGVCLPESCHSRSFRVLAAGSSSKSSAEEEQQQQKLANRRHLQRLIDSQFELPKSLYIDESLELDDVYCLPDEQSQHGMPLSGKLALAFIGTWLLFAAYATYYQEVVQHNKKLIAAGKKSDDDHDNNLSLDARSKLYLSVIDCFNLKKSWQDFLGEEYDDQKRALIVVNNDDDDNSEPGKRVSFALKNSVGRQPNSSPPEPNRLNSINFNTFNPIKIIGMMLVVLCHAMLVINLLSMNGLSAYNQMERDPWLFAGLIGTGIIDSFFVMTGLFMAYIAMCKSANFRRQALLRSVQSREKSHAIAELSDSSDNSTDGQQINDGDSSGGKIDSSKMIEATKREPVPYVKLFFKQWLHAILSRHLRLLPMVFLVYWLKRSVLLYSVAYGQPLMDYGLGKDSISGACKRESWLTPFTMATAFAPIKPCLQQTWSVSVDLFFCIAVTPIVLIMTWRPKLALLLAGLMGSISLAWSILDASYSIPDKIGEELFQMKAYAAINFAGDKAYLYTYPPFKLNSCLAGAIAGYLVYEYETKGRLPNWFKRPNWFNKLSHLVGTRLIGTAMGIISLIYYLDSSLNDQKLIGSLFFVGYERFIIIHAFTTLRVVWAFLNAFILYHMATNWSNTFLARLFAHKFWSVVVRLNFAILLIHMDVYFYLATNSVTTFHYNKLDLFKLCFVTYTICIPLAILLHVIFENPLYKLAKRHLLPS